MKLSEMRAKTGMTQYEVANKVGISRVSYCNIEIGRRRPSVPVAKKLGAALGFDWTMLFENEESERDCK